MNHGEKQQILTIQTTVIGFENWVRSENATAPSTAATYVLGGTTTAYVVPCAGMSAHAETLFPTILFRTDGNTAMSLAQG